LLLCYKRKEAKEETPTNGVTGPPKMPCSSSIEAEHKHVIYVYSARGYIYMTDQNSVSGCSVAWFNPLKSNIPGKRTQHR